MMRSLVLAALVTLVPSLASADSPGWITKCSVSHSAADDPLVFPGQPGAAHLHDFFGNRTVAAGSTYDSMRAGATTCGTGADTAGYWSPALFKNGVKVNPGASFNGKATEQKFYYRDGHYKSGTVVEPFPANFRMIQGYGHATSVSDANSRGAKWGSKMWWGCSDNSAGGKPTSPPSCKSGIITLHVTFPSCWNGVMPLKDAVAEGLVKFPDDGTCPSGFSRKLPILIQRLEYPAGTSGSGITVASGPPYTAHADFWNTWDQPKLTSLVNDCLNLNRNCGTDP